MTPSRNESIVLSSDAGWSSMVARRAHNPKVVGSNPAPATNFKNPRFSEGFLLPAISVKRQTGWLLREGVMTGSFIFDTFSVLAQVGRKWRADK